MGIFDKIFRRKITEKMAPDKMPSFWEDDYCQIEIVPRKNIKKIRESINKTDAFAEKNRTKNGFTDIFMREDLPFPTLNEEFRVDYFESILARNDFIKASHISYDGYKIIDCAKETSNAYSFGYFNIFYDCKDEFINNLWITNSLSSTNHIDNILETLYEFGEGSQLVLVDWNNSKFIDLSNRNQIRKYLTSY